MHFSIKRDFILIFLFNAVYVFVLLALAFLGLMPDAWFFWVIFAIVFGLMVIYDTSVIFASCDIDDDKITFKTGIFRYEIPFNQIARVEKSKNLYSSLAHSVDRLRILTYDEKDKQQVYYIAVNDNDKLMDLINLKIGQKEENKNTSVNNNEKTEALHETEPVVIEGNVVEEKTEVATTTPKEKVTKSTKAKKTTGDTSTKKVSSTKKSTSTTKKSATTKKTSTKKTTSKN